MVPFLSSAKQYLLFSGKFFIYSSNSQIDKTLFRTNQPDQPWTFKKWYYLTSIPGKDTVHRRHHAKEDI